MDDPLNYVEHDECCSPRLTLALRRGIQGESWVCPKCGCTWLAAMDAEKGLTVWSPEVFVAIW